MWGLSQIFDRVSAPNQIKEFSWPTTLSKNKKCSPHCNTNSCGISGIAAVVTGFGCCFLAFDPEASPHIFSWWQSNGYRFRYISQFCRQYVSKYPFSQLLFFLGSPLFLLCCIWFEIEDGNPHFLAQWNLQKRQA